MTSRKHSVDMFPTTGVLVDMFPHTDGFLDMFPHTGDIHNSVSGHVETVCLLGRRKPDAYVHIDVDLEDYYKIKDSKIDG